MTRQQLLDLIMKHELRLKVARNTVGSFHQYELTSDYSDRMRAFANELQPLHNMVSLEAVTNPEHPEYGLRFVLIDSCVLDGGALAVADVDRAYQLQAFNTHLETAQALYGNDNQFLSDLATFLCSIATKITISGHYGDVYDAATALSIAAGEKQEEDEDDEEDDDEYVDITIQNYVFKYTIRTDEDEFVSEGTCTVAAMSPTEARELASKWVEENDSKHDERINPQIVLDFQGFADDVPEGDDGDEAES